MRLKLGDMVRYNGRGVLMTVGKHLANGKVVCACFRGEVYHHHSFDACKLVKEPPMYSYTVEVVLPSRSWKRNKIRTHIVTAHSEHEARRKVLCMYLNEKRRVMSTQVVERYPDRKECE